MKKTLTFIFSCSFHPSFFWLIGLNSIVLVTGTTLKEVIFILCSLHTQQPSKYTEKKPNGQYTDFSSRLNAWKYPEETDWGQTIFQLFYMVMRGQNTRAHTYAHTPTNVILRPTAQINCTLILTQAAALFAAVHKRKTPGLPLETNTQPQTHLQIQMLFTYHKFDKPCASCISYKDAWVVRKSESFWPPMESSPLCLSTVHVETHLIMLHHHLTGRANTPFKKGFFFPVSLRNLL